MTLTSYRRVTCGKWLRSIHYFYVYLVSKAVIVQGIRILCQIAPRIFFYILLKTRSLVLLQHVRCHLFFRYYQNRLILLRLLSLVRWISVFRIFAFVKSNFYFFYNIHGICVFRFVLLRRAQNNILRINLLSKYVKIEEIGDITSVLLL